MRHFLIVGLDKAKLRPLCEEAQRPPSKCDVTDERKQGTMLDSDRRSVEEHLARELLNYFTGQHPTGVKYEDQPPEVRELWLGAARVAMKVLQDISPLIL